MRARVALLVALGLAACGGSQKGKGSSQTLTPAEISERARESIVVIRDENGLGTGFVVWQDGRIVTNLHVIAPMQTPRVVLPDGRELEGLQVLAADFEHDLAVVRVNARDLKPLSLGDTTRVRTGDRVVAIGHPMGLEKTVSDGLISAVRDVGSGDTIFQITAPIAPGSSGGPLFNDRGEVIGVTTRFAAVGQNLNFAVPAHYIKPLLLSDRPISMDEIRAQVRQIQAQQILSGCDPDELQVAVKAISDAIDKGVPVYNSGDHQGCYDIYRQTALGLVDKLENCQGVTQELLRGLDEAKRAEVAGAKAWAMRHAFDRILFAVEAFFESLQR